MSLKEFWRTNKNGYLWSCLIFTLLGFFVGAIKRVSLSSMSIFVLIGLPIIFLMGFSLYEFVGGDKE